MRVNPQGYGSPGEEPLRHASSLLLRARTKAPLDHGATRDDQSIYSNLGDCSPPEPGEAEHAKHASAEHQHAARFGNNAVKGDIARASSEGTRATLEVYAGESTANGDVFLQARIHSHVQVTRDDYSATTSA